MNTKGFKQMLIGEKMPDKDDPKYKERYERDVRAGRKFARMCRIDKAAAKVQKFADLHKTMFLVIVFGFVGVSFSFNIYRMARAYHYQGATHRHGETGLADKGSPSGYGECKEHSKDQ